MTAEPSEIGPVHSHVGPDTPGPAPDASTAPVGDGGTDKLRMKANVMQNELGTILASVRSIKDNCAKLKTENRSLQEYIESLMAKR